MINKLLKSRYALLQKRTFFLFLIVQVSLFQSGTAQHNCDLPEEWIGPWSRGDLEETAPPITIQPELIRIDGATHLQCIQSQPQNEFYIFKENHVDHPNENCFQCWFFTRKHENVLFYRKSDCHETASLDACHFSDHFKSLYRLGAERVPCPIESFAMSMDYSKGGTFCPAESSKSRVESCSDNSIFKLNYEACVDVPRTEQSKETVACIGNWTENSANYFVAKVRGRNSNGFRCFNYAPLLDKHSSALIGYNMSRSGSTGSCAETASPAEGSWVYKLKILKEKEENETNFLTLPNWLDVEENGTTWNSMNMSVIWFIQGRKIEIHPNPQNNSTNEKRSFHFIAEEIESETEVSVTLRVIQVLFERCIRIPICMDVYRKSENVIEIQIHHQLPPSESVCLHKPKDQIPVLFVYTLIRPNTDSISCPLPGMYTLQLPTSTVQHFKQHIGECEEAELGPTSMELGCSEPTKIQFLSNCSSSASPLNSTQKSSRVLSTLECMGWWKEEENTFIVGSNSNFGVRGYRCFAFGSWKNGKMNVSLLLDSCKLSTNQTLIRWNFSTSLQESCSKNLSLQDPSGGKSKGTMSTSFVPRLVLMSAILLIPKIVCW